MTKLDIGPMKAKALNFPEPMRSIILSEPDTMDTQEFIAKLSTWEKTVAIAAKEGKNIDRIK
ncbi:MAG: hypothetical protein AAE986_00825 [Thermoplasmataceae archaeon]|jgi:hypothetical protein